MENTTSPMQYTNFKKYCLDNNITEKQLLKDTGLSPICINNVLYVGGKINKATLRRLSVTVGLTEGYVKELVTTLYTQTAFHIPAETE